MPIRLLAEEVVAGISAGEVIERPASVVKELLENSVDAGATRIKIEVEAGGMKLIRVTDNGRGISAREGALAFERHATSKLSGLDDLESLETFGFRGEALAAIAATAEVEMLTRVDGQPAGTRISGGEGKPMETAPAGCEKGAIISVRNLFRTVPARLKFMRSPRAENAAITRAVEPYVLSRPDIHLILVVDGEEKINTPASSNPAVRSAPLFGSGGESLVPFNLEKGGIRVWGLAQPPGMVHGRGRAWILVNGRPVEDRGLRGALIASYGGQIPRNMFPDAVIQVDVPPGRLDVHVHPAKSEVRFADPYQVRDILVSALHAAFRSLPSGVVNGEPGLAAPYSHFLSSGTHTWGGSGMSVNAPSAAEPGTELPWSHQTGPVGITTTPGGGAAPKAGSNGISIIGQVIRTYIVAHDANGLFLIDQHAAHEKVIYERITRTRGKSGSQQMLIPATIDLAPAEAAEAEQYRTDLESLGFEFDALGGRTYAVRAIPSQTAACADPAVVFRDLLRETSSSDAPPGSDDAYRRFAAGVACKMAVKAGDFLDTREMEALLGELYSVADPRSCPHGRPTMVEFSIDSLARMFKRT